MFHADFVPVGKDQVQHIEIAREIAQRFNHRHKETFKKPLEIIEPNIDVILGLDGRKMSKSYNNTIPLCCSQKKLHKIIKGIPTDSADRYAPKNPETSLIYHYFKNFTSKKEQDLFYNELKEGMSWGDAKNKLFLVMDEALATIREKYDYYMGNTNLLDEILEKGSTVAKKIAERNMTYILERMV